MRLTRSDKNLLSDWWFTVDRLMLGCVLLLMVGGLVLSLAASPSVAERLGYDTFHFFRRHALALGPAVIILISASLLPPRLMRRVCLIVFACGIALMVATLFLGPETKGATRWLRVGGLSVQPSELVKPAFVILCAWFFAESERRADMPSLHIAIGLYAVFALLLVLQPDFGQAFLVTMVWAGLFFIAGMPLFWVAVLAGGMAVAVGAAYLTVPHVTRRIDSFFDPSGAGGYQVRQALESFSSGGWFGKGPGEGTIKEQLPDSHADFVFAVIAEEFGVIACLAIAALFAFIVTRGLARALRESDSYIRYAIMGLMMLFGLQALVNMSVNVGLLPAKGMTLPFLSYGGSSLVCMAATMGFALGLTRRRPETAHAPLARSGAERPSSEELGA